MGDFDAIFRLTEDIEIPEDLKNLAFVEAFLEASDGFETPEDEEFDELRSVEFAAEMEHMLAGDYDDYIRELYGPDVIRADF